jgi:hypothetical protein
MNIQQTIVRVIFLFVSNDTVGLRDWYISSNTNFQTSVHLYYAY